MVHRKYLVSVLYVLAFLPFAATSSAFYKRAPPACVTQPQSPPPGGFVCNQMGTATNTSLIARSPAATQITCRDRCLNDQPTCISFSYGGGTGGKRCELYNKKIIQSQFKRGPTQQTFWNRNCFRKTCTCPSGLKNCSNNCVDVSGSDNGNCGGCGKKCDSGFSCSAGSCQPGACGTTPFDTGSPCVAPVNGPSCCSGQCVDLENDNSNCGSCGFDCNSDATGAHCDAGQCQCVDDYGTVYGTLGDNSNCGQCYNSCESGNCVSGTCKCPSGGNLHDNENCADCGDDCRTEQTGASCVQYFGDVHGCLCPDRGRVGDLQNCAKCGDSCGEIDTCTNGNCMLTDYFIVGSGSQTAADGELAVEYESYPGVFRTIFSVVNRKARYRIDADTGYIRDQQDRYGTVDTLNNYVVFVEAVGDRSLTCSLDDTTFEITCSAVLDGVTYSYFAVTSDSPYQQSLYMALTDTEQYPCRIYGTNHAHK